MRETERGRGRETLRDRESVLESTQCRLSSRSHLQLKILKHQDRGLFCLHFQNFVQQDFSFFFHRIRTSFLSLIEFKMKLHQGRKFLLIGRIGNS